MINRIHDLGTVLSIWAHPDDETYLAGGTMAAARDVGLRVVCVTATAGEQGTSDTERWPPARLGQVRRWEAAAAMSVLGVEEHRCLGLPDGGLARLDTEGEAAIAALLDEIRPDTVLTFGPDGATFHPDHLAVHRWVAAVGRRHDDPPRVLLAGETADHLARFRRTYEESGMYMSDLRPVGVLPDDLALHRRLEGWELDRKLTALRAMATQTAGIDTDDPTFMASVSEEAFVPLIPAVVEPRALSV